MKLETIYHLNSLRNDHAVAERHFQVMIDQMDAGETVDEALSDEIEDRLCDAEIYLVDAVKEHIEDLSSGRMTAKMLADVHRAKPERTVKLVGKLIKEVGGFK